MDVLLLVVPTSCTVFSRAFIALGYNTRIEELFPNIGMICPFK